MWKLRLIGYLIYAFFCGLFIYELIAEDAPKWAVTLGELVAFVGFMVTVRIDSLNEE